MTKHSPRQPERFQVFGVDYCGISFRTLAEAKVELDRVSSFVPSPYIMRIWHTYVGRVATGTAHELVTA